MTALNKQALLIENGQLVADTLRHLADNEIDSDYFAITSTNENGTEIDHELVITDYALQASGTVDELVRALEAAGKRIAELEAREVKPVAWMRNANVTSFMSRFTTDENYAVEQWGDDAVALYSLPVDFIPACFTDERNLMYINERGRETSLIWSERNSEDGDIQLFRAAGIGVKGE